MGSPPAYSPSDLGEMAYASSAGSWTLPRTPAQPLELGAPSAEDHAWGGWAGGFGGGSPAAEEVLGAWETWHDALEGYQGGTLYGSGGAEPAALVMGVDFDGHSAAGSDLPGLSDRASTLSSESGEGSPGPAVALRAQTSGVGPAALLEHVVPAAAGRSGAPGALPEAQPLHAHIVPAGGAPPAGPILSEPPEGALEAGAAERPAARAS